MKKITYISILLITASCYKLDHEILNLNNNRIDILGHAGMGISSSYPINSFESVTKALALGADGTEIDVQLTADGVLVAFHDRDLEHSSNKKGLVNNITWSELEGAFYNLVPYHNYKIVSLKSIFANTENLNDFTFVLDCKLYSDHIDNEYLEEFSFALIELLDSYSLSEKTIIESPDPNLLSLINQQGVPYRLFWYINNLSTSLEEVANWPVNGFTINDDNVSAIEIEQAHDRGYQVALFNTLSKGENMDAIKKNPDIIQTDKLKHLLKVLK